MWKGVDRKSIVEMHL